MPATVPTHVEEFPRIECACCQEAIIDRGGYCPNCATPLDLSRSVAARETPAQFVSVLGASNAGKTVYLGLLLDILSRGAGEIQGLPNGSFSVDMQQQTMSALARRRFPEKTPSEADCWRWVHCEVAQRKKPKEFVDIVTPDVAGEAITVEVDQPGTYQTIETVVRKSTALLVLMDSVRIRDFGRDEDFFGLKLASYIATQQRRSGGILKRKLATPIAVVFTKSDACPEARQDPVRFASSNLPGLVQFCRRNFTHHHFFSTGVVGSAASVTNDHGWQVQIPLHIEPHGITEPLEWVIQHL